MTIQKRLTLTISALIAFTLAGTLVILGLSEFVHLRGEQEREQKSALEKLAGVCREAVLNQNDLLLLNYLDSLREAPAFVYAAFVGPDNRIRVHSDRFLMGTEFTAGGASSGTLLGDLAADLP